MGFYSEARKLTTGEAYPRTPSQHAEVLHPLKAQGQVFIGRKLPPTGEWSQDPISYHPWELDAVLYHIAGARDIYLSMNRFEGARKVLQQHVRELSTLYVDVDHYDVPELAGRAPEAVLELALELLRSAGIPQPSLVLCSGQGLYLIWLHTPVGWKELVRWQDCQYRIWRILEPLGADPKSRDAARVLRVTGTTNSKNGGPVYALRDAGPRRPFDELATSILTADLGEDDERPAADLYDLRVQHATRREFKAPRYRTERSLWLAKWVDLQTCAASGTARDRWATSGTDGCSSLPSRGAISRIRPSPSSSSANSWAWRSRRGAGPREVPLEAPGRPRARLDGRPRPEGDVGRGRG